MWKTKFMDIMAASTISLDDIERGMQLKDLNLPSKIYKFRSVNPYSLQNLTDDTVWICSASDYNDPYECCTKVDFRELRRSMPMDDVENVFSRVNLDRHLSSAEIADVKASEEPFRALTYALLKKSDAISPDRQEDMVETLDDVFSSVMSDHYQELNQSIQTGMKICSFSERKDSPVMWSHYADNHSGFCIEYDVSFLPLGDVRRRLLFPVIYSGELFDATQYLCDSMSQSDFNNIYATLAATHKAPDWSYECEWRFVLPMGESFHNQNYPMPTPSAIYVGAKIDTNHKRQIINIARAKTVPVYQMNMAPRRFNMVAGKEL